jgi:hypothetical protein
MCVSDVVMAMLRERVKKKGLAFEVHFNGKSVDGVVGVIWCCTRPGEHVHVETGSRKSFFFILHHVCAVF